MRIREAILDQLSIAAGQNIKERDYWLKQLSGHLAKSSFPYDFKESAPGELRDSYKTLNFNITGDLFLKLIKLSNASDHMLHMILVAGWVLLLDKYTFDGNGDIIIGSPIYRQEDESEGRLINAVLPLRHRLTPGMTFKDLLMQVRETIVQGTEYYSYPMEILAEQLGLTSKGPDFPIFDVGILVENIHDKKDLEHLRLDMTISFLRTGENIRGRLEYNTGRYLEHTVEWIIKHFFYLMVTVLSDVNQEIGRLSILSLEEKSQILYGFNTTEKKYPDYPAETIHRWFERQVLQTPGQPALEYAGKELTYHQLNQQANRLAYYLRIKGVKPQGVVGIMMNPCIEMIVGILGILKAGGAYLPIDPTYPQKRILKILNDGGASLLLTKDKELDKLAFTAFKKLPDEETLKQVKGIAFAAEKDRARLKQETREIIFIDNLADTLDPFPGGNPTHVNQSHHLLYLISTSGSTGEPKSLMLEHRNIMNLLNFEFSGMGIDFSRHILQFASIGFDVSAQEIFSALLCGGKLWLIDRDLKGDVLRLFDLIRENKISVVFWPPAFLKLVFSEAMYIEAFPKTITHIIAAGEQLIVPQSMKEYLIANRVYLVNNYGPAETHVVTSLTIDPTGNIPGRPSIGKPISNTAIYILDKRKNIQPIGVIGELHIAGANVGRGYLNRVELTAEKFINYNVQNCKPGGLHASMQSCSHASNQHHTHSPITPIPHYPIYRTGDLARWLPDGNIEFMGRVDYQVQIRGFRVELGEIERRLKEIEHIKQALVLERGTGTPGGNNYLCAYVVSEKKIDVSGLKKILSNSLPDFMIPAYIMEISGIPLTANGKVDSKALPEPGTTGSHEAYIAPQNEIEETLLDIWSALLDIEKQRISVTADFFQLGGNSLKATVLIAKVHKAFNLGITLGEMFKKPTIRGLWEYIKSRRGEDRYSFIKPVESKEYYTLSSPQQRLYILQQMDETAAVYNLPLVVCLEGAVDENRLEFIFERLIQRHESFRTSIQMVQGEPVQRIHPDARVEVKVDDNEGTRGLAPLPIELAASTIQDFIRPFDLSQAPLLRVGMIKLEAGKSILMVDMHHIITDGISLRIFTKEFVGLYSDQHLLPLRIQYKDYSQWQTGEEEKKAIGKQEEYWLKQFEGGIPVLALPLDFTRPALQRFEGKTVTFEMDKAEALALRRIAAAEGATLFMVLITLYTIFLSKISNQEDIIIGTPVSGRRHTDLEPIIGMFVNTLALRNYPGGEKDFHVFLLEVKERILQAFDNQLYPFEDLVEELGPQVNKDVSRNPIFDAMFVLDDGDIADIKIPGLQLEPYPYENRTAKFDLTLRAIPLDERLRFNLEYSTALFKEETIQRFTGYFKRVVSAVVEDIKKKISRIEIISPEEKRQLLVDFNSTEAQYPKDKTIHELFAAQAEKIPSHIALVGKEKGWMGRGAEGKKAEMHLSYRELHEKSSQLARLLIENGVHTDTIVGIMVERSVVMAIGLLGVLTARGAYLPIDPQYPGERRRYMIEDAHIDILLTDSSNSPSKVLLPVPESQVMVEAAVEEKSGQPQGLPLQIIKVDRYVSTFTLTSISRQDASAENLAYIMYTSGSTGKPKAVMVEHRNVVRLVKNTNYIEFKENQGILQTGALEFDASTFEIWGALLNGLSLYLVDKDQILNPELLKETIKNYHISTIWMTSPLFNQMVQADVEIFAGLTNLLVGGDVLSPSHINRVKTRFPALKVINGYGPTENTTFSTTFLIDKEYTNIPIGSPISNSTAIIIDKSHHLQPIKVAGELCVGGEGVSRGYLNDPELTSEKFRRAVIRDSSLVIITSKKPSKIINNKCLMTNDRSQKFLPNDGSPHYPITPLPHSPIYITGDLARWLTDGNIEFLGRMDHQVKIRGYRIELGEIKSQLLKYDRIKDTVVVMAGGEPGDNYLCAYIVASSPMTASELKEYLSSKLPGYMIPSYFVMLEEIPLTPNGKVDHKALPPPEVKGESEYIAPRDEIEKKLALIWADLLFKSDTPAHPLPGIDDNFFQLGGHSLTAAILIARIHQTFDVKIPLAKIFEFPTIREQAAEIKRSDKTAFIHITKVEEKEYYPLSYHQKRIWFLHQMERRSSAFNIIGIINLDHEVDTTLIQRALHQLVDRHESFRTGFKLVEGEVSQFIVKEVALPFEIIDISSLQENKQSEEQDRIFEGLRRISFDLDQPPLFRAMLIKLDTRRYELLLNIHHIVSDGWSMEIVRDEFQWLYREYRCDNHPRLEPLAFQYKDFAWWQNQQLALVTHWERAVQFWERKLEKGIPTVDISGDFNTRSDNRKGAAWEFIIGQDLKEKIEKLAQTTNTTVFMVTFTAYLLLILRFSGREDIACSIINAGREHLSLHPVMGIFVNSIIFHIRMNPEEPFSQLLQRVKHDTLELFHYQDYPLELVFDHLKMKYPQIPLSFNMLNMQTLSASQELNSFEANHIEFYQDVKFDMEMYLAGFKNAIVIRLAYKRELYRPETPGYMMEEYIKMLEFFTRHTGKSYQAYRQSGKTISLWT